MSAQNMVMGKTISKKTIEDIDVSGKRVLIRVDFNVPQDADGRITDDRRIKGALPTIEYLLSKNCAVILMSHMGRPKGQVHDKYRLDQVRVRLSELLGRDVFKTADCIGDIVWEKANALQSGQILLLENLRFHSEEEENDPEFAKKLAGLADVYVNDAFGTAHRAHASTEGITKYLPGVAGFLMEREIQFLSGILENPGRPFVAIMGGAKISDKIKVIDSLVDKVDVLLIGGAMAYTFLKEQGVAVGASLVEGVIEDKKGQKVDCPALARQAIEKAKTNNSKLLLPVDHIQAKPVKEMDAGGHEKLVWKDACLNGVKDIQEGFAGVDIGPETSRIYAEEIQKAKTVIWNGPMGIFEEKPFSMGTLEVARACAAASEQGGITVVGGGDSVAAVESLGYSQKITHISTGGGAALELLEGKTLPGLAVLEDKDS